MIVIMSGSIARLFDHAPRRALAEGEMLFGTGAPVGAMYMVVGGCIALMRHGPEGAAMVLHRALPGQVVAEASAWSDRYHCDAVATGSAEVAVLPRHAFRAALDGDATLAADWARQLAQAVQAARLRAEIRGLRGVSERLDAWLGAGGALPARGSWQDLAAELGVSREALYRELARRRRMQPQPSRPQRS